MDPHPNLTPSVITGLGWLYLLLAGMNGVWTAFLYKKRESLESIVAWAFASAMLFMIALAHFSGANNPESFVIRMPDAAKAAIDTVIADARLYFLFTIILFALVILLREWFVKPAVAWFLLNVAILFVALSMTDWDFRQIVGKPDNVPIVSMLFIVGYFTWLYFKRAVDNDRRVAEGRPLYEQEDNDKILVWPDLVYTELICMVVATVILVAWGVVLQAPLEEPANAAKTPNPSKAPWYFLGLQEMLVYYDPWLAGVVFPSVIIVGLMAIPYIDFNKLGSGYYTFNQRKFSVIVFMFGFLPLWIAMIILGTFLRGPNWNIFGVYEYWDVHKLEVLNNVNLSEYFWLNGLGRGLPTAEADASALEKVGYILLREAPGFVAVLLYLVVIPPLLAATWLRGFFERMGFIRYMVFVNILLLMAALPIKMLLRWSFNMKYIVAIPEWFFNI